VYVVLVFEGASSVDSDTTVVVTKLPAPDGNHSCPAEESDISSSHNHISLRVQDNGKIHLSLDNLCAMKCEHLFLVLTSCGLMTLGSQS
jgi:hypothetical protein